MKTLRELGSPTQARSCQAIGHNRKSRRARAKEKLKKAKPRKLSIGETLSGASFLLLAVGACLFGGAVEISKLTYLAGGTVTSFDPSLRALELFDSRTRQTIAVQLTETTIFVERNKPVGLSKLYNNRHVHVTYWWNLISGNSALKVVIVK